MGKEYPIENLYRNPYASIFSKLKSDPGSHLFRFQRGLT
jgi:hypothetical protein